MAPHVNKPGWQAINEPMPETFGLRGRPTVTEQQRLRAGLSPALQKCHRQHI